MTPPLCVGHQCGQAPPDDSTRRTAAPGLRLCTTCYHDLKANLAELPEIYADCESVLHPRRDPTLQRVSGSRQSAGIRLDESAIAARSGIIGSLASWAALVADERAVGKPVHRHPGTLTDFLLTHLTWLLAHPTAADFAEEISEVARTARHSAYTPPEAERRVPTAPARATGRRVPTQLAALAAGVAEATIRKWASRGQLTRYGSPSRAEYDLDELLERVADKAARTPASNG